MMVRPKMPPLNRALNPKVQGGYYRAQIRLSLPEKSGGPAHIARDNYQGVSIGSRTYSTSWQFQNAKK